MLAFSDVLTDVVQDLRVEELKLSKDYRRLLCLRVLLGTTIPVSLQQRPSLTVSRNQHPNHRPISHLSDLYHHFPEHRSAPRCAFSLHLAFPDIPLVGAHGYRHPYHPNGQHRPGLF